MPSRTNNFHFPDWPPQRLAKEAVCAWGLRHLSEPPVDYAAAPWPVVRGMIFAYLRHSLTEYDEHLRTRYEHDPKFRDEMAAQVAAAAFRQYPWLRDDPRPFPEAESEPPLLFDTLSRELADLHTLRDHLVRAIHDLRRQGGRNDEITELEATLAETRRDIDACYKFLSSLSSLKTLPEKANTRTIVMAHSRIDGYNFFSGKPVAPNRIEYVGFCCPGCGASVARWKQIIPMGQGYRCLIFSCHCLTALIHTSGGGGRIRPMTVKYWTRYCEQRNAS
jgi:hypothetical protein